MTIKLEAAARLGAATQLVAAYEGTKVQDLANYIRTLVPSVKIPKEQGGGGPGGP